MRIGLIARSDSTGLAVQSKEFYDHMKCVKALVIDMTEMSNSPIITPHAEKKYPGQRVWRMKKGFQLTGGIPKTIIDEFLDGLDLVFTIETAYDYNIFTEAKRHGIKTVLQLNYEFLDYPNNITSPDLFLAPSMWYWDWIPDPKKLLTAPVDTDKFHIQRKEKTFVHIVGRPAYNDRNGTYILSEALKSVRNKITVIVKSQQAVSLRNRNRNINLIVDYSNKENYWDNYVDVGGVMVLPRKFGGLCLPMHEALACGMPVITTNCSPNNTWLPPEWLVGARERGILHCKRKCSMFEMNPKLLAHKIDEFCDPSFYDNAVQKALELRNTISWNTLLPVYQKTFEDVCGYI